MPAMASATGKRTALRALKGPRPSIFVPKVVQNRVITEETLQSKQCLQSTIGPQLIEMGKTARSSNDAQHKAHKDLARLVMIGTFGLIELSALELFNQSNPSQKLDQNRQASKGGDRSECVAEFDLSSTKKGPKFLPIRSVPAPEKNP
jgi:hypothetical protein